MEKTMLEKIFKMNRLIMILLIAILIVLTLGVSKMYTTDEKEVTNTNTNSEYNTNYDVSSFKEITADELKKTVKKGTHVLYIGRETCGWCAAFLPALWEAEEEYKYQTLYIDIAKIIDFEKNVISDEEAYNTMIGLTGEGYETYVEENFGATPMVLVFKDGKIIAATTGYTEYSTFKTFLNDAGIK
ncbi:MAG: thioredoxin family protein [Bacilli bacterium]|nr:thioredoxin family protein [Bacilli bacterium]